MWAVGWQIFCCSNNIQSDYENTESFEFWVTNRLYQVGKFINMESMKNEDWLQIFLILLTMFILSMDYGVVYLTRFIILTIAQLRV